MVIHQVQDLTQARKPKIQGLKRIRVSFSLEPLSTRSVDIIAFVIAMTFPESLKVKEFVLKYILMMMVRCITVNTHTDHR